MKKYTFAYGHGTQSVYLPQEHVRCEMGISAVDARDAGEEIAAALRRRDGHMALQDVVDPDGTVVIIVNDGTRNVHTEQMLDAIMAELQRLGLRNEQVTVLIATGNHRPATDREIQEICGPVWSKALTIRQHDCRDAENLATPWLPRQIRSFSPAGSPFTTWPDSAAAARPCCRELPATTRS